MGNTGGPIYAFLVYAAALFGHNNRSMQQVISPNACPPMAAIVRLLLLILPVDRESRYISPVLAHMMPCATQNDVPNNHPFGPTPHLPKSDLSTGTDLRYKLTAASSNNNTSLEILGTIMFVRLSLVFPLPISSQGKVHAAHLHIVHPSPRVSGKNQMCRSLCLMSG